MAPTVESLRTILYSHLWCRRFAKPLESQGRIDSIRGLPARNFLDFGSGTGCYSFYLARKPAARVYCMDIDASRINDCEKIASQTGQENITFLTGSGHERLQDFHSECMDMALAIEVLQCVPDLNLFYLNSIVC